MRSALARALQSGMHEGAPAAPTYEEIAEPGPTYEGHDANAQAPVQFGTLYEVEQESDNGHGPAAAIVTPPGYDHVSNNQIARAEVAVADRAAEAAVTTPSGYGSVCSTGQIARAEAAPRNRIQRSTRQGSSFSLSGFGADDTNT